MKLVMELILEPVMKFALLLPALLLSFTVHSQGTSRDPRESKKAKEPKDSSAGCIAYWKMGETKTYSIVHDKSTTQPGHSPTIVRFAYEAQVSVVDSSAKFYTIKWVYHLTPEMRQELMKQPEPLPIFEGMQMIFTISDVGTFVELFNWEEVRDNYIQMLESSLPENPDSAAKAAVSHARSFFRSKEMVEGALIKEIQLYHLPFGYSFSTKEVREGTKLTNPFGGGPIPAIQSYRITQLDPQQDLFTLVIRQYTDKVGAKGIFDINDFTEYRIIPSSGWIRHISYKRTAVNGGITQTDGYTIDLKN